jgi:hypothetical protein
MTGGGPFLALKRQATCLRPFRAWDLGPPLDRILAIGHTSAPASPLNLLQHSTRGSPAKLVDVAPNLLDDAIHCFRKAIGCVSGYILLQRPTIEFAAGDLDLGHEALGLFKDFVGDGDCSLHATSITAGFTLATPGRWIATGPSAYPVGLPAEVNLRRIEL